MFYDNLKTHRIAAGLTIAKLHLLSGVSVATISRIEKHDPATKVKLVNIIDALNKTDKFKLSPLDPDTEITATSKFGAKVVGQPDEDQTA